jgi:hypothetical protein
MRFSTEKFSNFQSRGHNWSCWWSGAGMLCILTESHMMGWKTGEEMGLLIQNPGVNLLQDVTNKTNKEALMLEYCY